MGANGTGYHLTYPALKLGPDQPEATRSLDRHTSLLLHHGKTVAISPGKQGSANVSTVTYIIILWKTHHHRDDCLWMYNRRCIHWIAVFMSACELMHMHLRYIYSLCASPLLTCTCCWLNLPGSGDSSDTTGVFGRTEPGPCCHSSPSHSPPPPYWMLSAAYCPICCL